MMSDKDVMKKEKADPSPKPIAKMEIIVLDTGDVEIDCMEYIATGVRGRPKAWRLSPKEFVRSVKLQVGDALGVLDRFLPGYVEPDDRGDTSVE